MKIDTRRICVKIFNIEVGQFFVIRMLILIVQNFAEFLVKINAINVFWIWKEFLRITEFKWWTQKFSKVYINSALLHNNLATNLLINWQITSCWL